MNKILFLIIIWCLSGCDSKNNMYNIPGSLCANCDGVVFYKNGKYINENS